MTSAIPQQRRTALRNSLFAVLIACAATLALYFPPGVSADNRTWDGGGGADTSWNNPLNWSSDTVPGTADVAVFDGTSPTDTTINVNINVGAMRLESGYARTITQSSGVNIVLNNVDGYSYVQAAGTFIGSNGDIDFNHNFTLNGGTFTASSGTTFFSGNFRRGDLNSNPPAPAGTFIHNGGTVVFDGAGDADITTNTSPLTVNNVTFNKTNSLFSALHGTVVVTGTLTLTDGRFFNANDGTFEARGAVNVATTFDGGDAQLLISGTARTITLSAGAQLIRTTLNAPNVTINTTGAGTITWNGVTLQAGAINQGDDVNFVFLGPGGNASYTQSGGAFNASSGSLAFNGDVTLSGGTFTGGSGDIHFNNQPGSTSFFRQPSGGTFTASSGTTFFSGNFRRGDPGSNPPAPGGAFNHNGGTVVFDGPAVNIDSTLAPLILNNLIFNKSNNSLSALNGAVRVTGALTLSDGRLGDFGGNGIEAQGAVNVGQNFDGTPFALPLTFTGSANQTFTNSGGQNPTGVWTLNKSGGTVMLASDLDLSNSTSGFSLINGTITTGNFVVNAGQRGIGRTAGRINGNLRREFNSTSVRTFDVGTANGYSPVTVNVTTLMTNPSSLTVGVRQQGHPQLNLVASLRRFWTLTESGDLTATLTFNYLETDVRGNESNYRVARITNGAATFLNSSIDAANNRATVAGVTDFSDWTLGDPTAPSPPLTINPGFANVISGTSQSFEALGGVGPFTFSLPVNNSGGTINPATGLYTAGATVNVTDTVRVTDSTSQTADATVNVSAAGANLVISGRIINTFDGSPLANTEVQLTGSQQQLTLTDASGNYTFGDLPPGGSFTVQPVRPNFTFEPSTINFDNMTAHQNGQDFFGTGKFRISGRVESLFEGTRFPLDGVTVTLSGAASRTKETDDVGNYIFNDLPQQAGSFTVTAAKVGFVINPPSINIPGPLESDQVASFEAQRPNLVGRIAFGGISVMNADGSGRARIVRSNPFRDRISHQYFGALNFTRDGTKIAFSGRIGSGAFANEDTYNILTVNADGSGLRNLTGNETIRSTIREDFDPAWSPDGNKIVFVRHRHGDGQKLFVMNADGSGATEVPLPGIHNQYSGPRRPDWSPDGTRIAFELSVNDSGHPFGGVQQIMTVNPDGSNLVQLTSGGRFPGRFSGHDSLSPSWSPDGTRIAFNKVVSADRIPTGSGSVINAAVFVMSADGSNQTQITPDGSAYSTHPGTILTRFIAWSPDGTKLAFISRRSELMAVNPDGSDLFVVTTGSFDELSWSRTAEVSTPAGSGVQIQSGATTLTFDDVTAPGTTTVTPIPTGYAEQAPAGFALSTGLPPGYWLGRFITAFEISTTANFTPPIEVCLDVSQLIGARLGLGSHGLDREENFNNFALLHNEGGTLVDRTTRRDFPTRTICGTVDSLSPFALAEIIDASRPSITGLIRDPEGNPLSSVSVSLTSTEARETTTNTDGLFSFVNVDAGGDYVAEPRRLGFLFDAPSRNFANLSSNQSVVFVGTAASFRIGGRVVDGNGNGIAGVDVSLDGSASNATITDAAGNYVFDNVPADGFYDVTPLDQRFNFTPTSAQIERLRGDATLPDFVAADATPPTPTDTTAPVTTVALSQTPTAFGWNNQNVTVMLTSADAESGVRDVTYSAVGAQVISSTTIAGASTSFVIWMEGTTTINLFATDNAGNTEATKTLVVKLDKIAPKVKIDSPLAVTYTVGQQVRASYGCNDARSGVASCVGTVPRNSFINTSAAGTYIFTVTAEDSAGNQTIRTVTYTVAEGTMARLVSLGGADPPWRYLAAVVHAPVMHSPATAPSAATLYALYSVKEVSR